MKIMPGFYIVSFNWTDAETKSKGRATRIIEAQNLHKAHVRFMEYVERIAEYGVTVDTGDTCNIRPLQEN
ncbi:MAG: hypothetical protein KQ78_01804 [Candidatus Izimaplasma bacterium HR2]|nr:MAG: hypothetical protein KQ78_01804 [Candidatus Izimaplasma bacterium HR2]